MWSSRLNGAMARGFLLFGGLASLLWSTAVLPSVRRSAPLREMTARIVADDRFKPGVLDDVLMQLEAEPAFPLSRFELARGEAVIRVRNAKETIARKTSKETDRDLASAEEWIKSALTLGPTDSLLWLVIYSLEVARNGFAPQNTRYLRQSYVVGPYEGWIALQRNRLALAVFPSLSEAAQAAVIAEFAEMVDSDFIDDAALNLMTVGWQHSKQLLVSLGSVDVVSKQRLSKRLTNSGINLEIPGVPIDERPWR